MSPKQMRLLLIGIGLLFSTLVLIGVGFLVYQSQMGKLIIASTPTDLNLTLDGKSVPANGTIYVNPGKHEFHASRIAFTDKKIEFEIAKGQTKTFEIYIFPDDDLGLEWAKQNPDEAAKLDGYFSNEYEQETERVFNGHTILRQLPILDRDFRIDHGASRTGKDFALYIQAQTQEGRDNALLTLEYLGFTPANFEIIYEDPPQ